MAQKRLNISSGYGGYAVVNGSRRRSGRAQKPTISEQRHGMTAEDHRRRITAQRQHMHLTAT